jgi:hypothetical protein
MSFRTIPNTSIAYNLLAFDSDGLERTDDPNGGVFSRTLIEKIKAERPTNIFLFSHGWKGDVLSAIDQYNRWIKAMVDLTDDSSLMGPAFKPLWIGLHWPSQPWGDESSGSFDPTVGKTLETLFEETVAHFGGTVGVRNAVKPIFDAYGKDPGASEIPPEAAQGYRDLAAAIEFSAGTADPAAGAPDRDGEPLDPQAALDADNMAAQSFDIAGAIGGGILSALRQLSFWTIKKRALTVGEGGMHQFIAAVQNGSDTKIHLIGHSFGCIVASSILNGPKGAGSLPRPIDSMAMLQGALSLWAYADAVPGSQQPGYFRSVLTRKVVSGPIVTTQSKNDSAVGVLYPAAVGLVHEADFGTELPKYGAVGAFGIQGTAIAAGREMLEQTGDYRFEGGTIYNLESSRFIAKKDGLSGAHSDIAGPQVAHALWQAALVS